MATYYGQVKGGGTAATRTGTKNSGIRASAQSYDGSVIVDMQDGKVSIEIADGSSFYGRTIFTGSIKELETKLSMPETFVKEFDDLTDEQKLLAISSYQAVRSVEEEVECGWERAEAETPYCRGYWISESGAVEVDI